MLAKALEAGRLEKEALDEEHRALIALDHHQQELLQVAEWSAMLTKAAKGARTPFGWTPPPGATCLPPMSCLEQLLRGRIPTPLPEESVRHAGRTGGGLPRRAV